MRGFRIQLRPGLCSDAEKNTLCELTRVALYDAVETYQLSHISCMVDRRGSEPVVVFFIDIIGLCSSRRSNMSVLRLVLSG